MKTKAECRDFQAPLYTCSGTVALHMHEWWLSCKLVILVIYSVSK